MTSSSETSKPEKSYLSAAVDHISPWGIARNSPANDQGGENLIQKPPPIADHTSLKYGLSSRKYPKDCPLLNPRWFYAVDAPKRKPKLLKEKTTESKPLPPPKKFVTFSVHDSRAIEAAYQKILETQEDSNASSVLEGDKRSQGLPIGAGIVENTSLNSPHSGEQSDRTIKVPVNEDFLFDVDVELRELAPVYWLGPIYEVRRGSWFYQEGSGLRPCEENLAAQLEEGYLKIKPFRYPKLPEKSAAKQTSSKAAEDPSSSGVSPNNEKGGKNNTIKSSDEDSKISNDRAGEDTKSNTKESPAPLPHQPEAYRLFGTYMNSVVTYQDDHTAWLASDGIMSRVSSTVYQRFAGGGYLAGVKLIRGYTEMGKNNDTKSDRPSTPTSGSVEKGSGSGLQLDERQQQLLKRRSAPPSITTKDSSQGNKAEERVPLPESRQAALKRQLSSIVMDSLDPEQEEEAVRRRDEKEMQDDYQEHDGEDQSRRIEHLILVTHGIGQRLGMRTETFNFVHDVNVLRQTLKSVYSTSEDLQALNSEIDKLPKNCRIQVLPVCWRHLLDFPQQGIRQTRREHDLADTSSEEDTYPSLDDITVEGIPFVRSLITDLALDVLLYQSAYREHIANIVLRESNRIYKLFRDRNPYFDGRVSLVGHSLGSAILFDLLCRQKENTKIHASSHHQNYFYNRRSSKQAEGRRDDKDLQFDFSVEDFYCLGSPIGLFQMLKGRTIAARHPQRPPPAESPLNPDNMDDPFLAAASLPSSYMPSANISVVTGLPYTVSSPKCAQLYNIFHPSDPIGYRLEPLIASAMSSLKPQALPYTKKGIFGASATQGLTGIGASIGQSVSGFWSSLSSGIASSLLSRSLGLTGEDVASLVAETQTPLAASSPTSIGAGTNISAGGVITHPPPLMRENTSEKQRLLAENTAAADQQGGLETAPTLIDDEIETLFSGFQKRQQSRQGEHNTAELPQTEENGQKLRREEMKVRGLNQNGRVDYCIQESVLDFNPINTIASHLSYWADEDVSHFVMSQLLSRYRTSKKDKTQGKPKS